MSSCQFSDRIKDGLFLMSKGGKNGGSSQPQRTARGSRITLSSVIFICSSDEFRFVVLS